MFITALDVARQNAFGQYIPEALYSYKHKKSHVKAPTHNAGDNTGAAAVRRRVFEPVYPGLPHTLTAALFFSY